MRILVTGSSGYIGDRLVRALCGEPGVERVVGLDVVSPREAPANFRFVKQDIRKSLTGLLEEEKIDAIAHLAYVLPPMHDTGLMEDINKGGTANVLRSAAEAGVKNILFTSSATAYGFWPDNDSPLTEESPLRGNEDMIYAKNKREIEWMLEEYRTAHPEVGLMVLRPCFVVGPGFKNPLARHLKKKLVLLPAGASPMQFVHEDDLLEVMLLFLREGRTGTYNVAAPGALDFREMVGMLGGTPVFLPLGLLRPLNSLAWGMRLTFLSEFPSPALNLMLFSWVADSSKLLRDTGFRFRYDSREAFRDFARWAERG